MTRGGIGIVERNLVDLLHTRRQAAAEQSRLENVGTH